MQRSSKQAKKKRTYGCSVHHAFPVVIAVFLCFLLSQGIFENFKKIPHTTELETNNKALLPLNDIHSSKDDKHLTETTLRNTFLTNLNETTALKLYRRHFNSDELIYKETIIKIEYLIDKFEYKQAAVELKSLAEVLPNSPRVLYASGLLFDRISEYERSNQKLKKCIEVYKKLINLNRISPSLLFIAGRRLVNRLQFLGKFREAIIQSEVLTKKIPLNLSLLNDLGIALLLYGKIDLAKDYFEKVLRLSGDEDAVALCHYAFILKTSENKLEVCIEKFSKCLTSTDDRVMDARFFYHVGDALQRLGRDQEAYEFYKTAVDKGLFRSVHQRSVYNEENLVAKPWWTPEETGYEIDLRSLEENWKEIRNEAFAQIDRRAGSFILEEDKLLDKGEWKQLNLFISGKRVDKNCEKVPYTCFLIEKIIPARTCTRGQVKFSLMKPGVHVWPHCGPTNCRLRAHLGLRIPQGVSIRVGNEKRSWQEGKVMVFDDSFEHEVWHNGTGLKLVLIVDLWHPDLSEDQRMQLSPV